MIVDLALARIPDGPGLPRAIGVLPVSRFHVRCDRNSGVRPCAGRIRGPRPGLLWAAPKRRSLISNFLLCQISSIREHSMLDGGGGREGGGLLYPWTYARVTWKHDVERQKSKWFCIALGCLYFERLTRRNSHCAPSFMSLVLISNRGSQRGPYRPNGE